MDDSSSIINLFNKQNIVSYHSLIEQHNYHFPLSPLLVYSFLFNNREFPQLFLQNDPPFFFFPSPSSFPRFSNNHVFPPFFSLFSFSFIFLFFFSLSHVSFIGKLLSFHDVRWLNLFFGVLILYEDLFWGNENVSFFFFAQHLAHLTLCFVSMNQATPLSPSNNKTTHI